MPCDLHDQADTRLLKVLTEAGGPRVTGDGLTFEPPYTSLPQENATCVNMTRK